MTQRNLSADLELDRARQMVKQGQTEQAKQLYGQIIARYPQNKKARKALKELQEKGKSQLSREDFERVMRLAGSGKLEAARADASQLLRAYPGQPALHNLLGVILQRQEQYEKAVVQFRQALEIQPDFTDALNNLGAACKQLGQMEQAEACYRHLVAATPQDADAWFNLGNVLRARRNFTDAVKAYQQSLQLKPFSADPYYNMGNTFIDLGEAEQAIECYQRAINIRKDFKQAQMRLGNAFASLGRPVPAAECYHEVLQAHPDEVEALLGLANAQLTLGSHLSAKESYARALELDPGNQQARHQLDSLQGRRTARAPEAYVRKVFDNYAAGFEQHLTGGLGYAAPANMRELAASLDMGDASGGRSIDLGCGTGLGGLAFQDLAGELIGVDLSSRMLREAEKKGVYRELIEGDIIKVLGAQEASFNLFLCFDTLVYIGDLAPLFKAVAKRAAPGSRFLCTTEHLQGDGDYKLQTSARYAHSQAYVAACAEQAGLKVLHFSETPLRKESGNWLSGGMYCLGPQ